MRNVVSWAMTEGGYSEPGKPIQDGFVESFDGRLSDECLSEHLFPGLVDARRILDAWRDDCNHARLRTSLGGLAPKEFATRSKEDQIEDNPNS